MSKSLPSTPNLRYLKEESKDILKAHKSGDASCCVTLRHLRQFRRKSDEDIMKAKVSLLDVQFALALEYGFRGWTDLKRFVEYMQHTNAKTEQELNLTTMKTWFEGITKGEWRDYLIRPDSLLHYNEEVRTWNEIYRLTPNIPASVLEDVVADGDRVSARVVYSHSGEKDTKGPPDFAGTWRFVGGRIAEAWIPQKGTLREPHTGPAGTRPAMTKLDRYIAKGCVPEINYVNILLHDLATSAPTHLTIAENVPLPEVRNPESGEIIHTSHEHVFLRLRTMTRETASIHVQEQGQDFIARISFGDEPEETCRIDVEKWEKK